MIRSITVTNYLGDSMKLDLTRPEDSGFVVKSITGIGAGKANINITEVVTNDGGLDNSARLPSRNIVLSLLFYFHSSLSIEEIRHKSYKYFPIKKKLTLRFETDERDLEIEGIVETNEPNIFSKEEGTDISIICSNPFFYSAGAKSGNTTVFYGIEPMFSFPFCNESLTENELIMGLIQHQQEKVVVYDGDDEVGITITIHAVGEASNITIYNTGTREIMRINTDKLAEFTGSGVIAGDDIIINTNKGNKSVVLVRGGITTNILNCMERGSDWFQLAKGDNVFAYTAETGSLNLQFKIFNRIVYEGV